MPFDIKEISKFNFHKVHLSLNGTSDCILIENIFDLYLKFYGNSYAEQV